MYWMGICPAADKARQFGTHLYTLHPETEAGGSLQVEASFVYIGQPWLYNKNLSTNKQEQNNPPIPNSWTLEVYM